MVDPIRPTALILRQWGPHELTWRGQKDEHMLRQGPKIPQKEKTKYKIEYTFEDPREPRLSSTLFINNF